MKANKMQTRTPNCLEANWLVTLALLPLFANTRHVTKCTENAALALSGRHLGSTRGAKVQNLSRSLRDVTFFRAATLWASQIGFGDDCHAYLPSNNNSTLGFEKVAKTAAVSFRVNHLPEYHRFVRAGTRIEAG